MDRLIIASVQQRIRVFATLDNYRNELRRFLRIAQHKHASLIVFPELGATMLVPPMLQDAKTKLLKHTELGRRRKAPLWQRYTAGVTWQLASRLPRTFTQTLIDYLSTNKEALWQTYCTFFGELAEQAQVTIVAPSGYFADPADGVVRNIAGVFGTDGQLLGYQAKVMLHEQDKLIAAPGYDWNVIETAVGSIGILLGSDMLHPEIARLLAYKGVEVLVGQGACNATVSYQQLRAGLLARMQDNQLFATASFLVGQNDMSGQEKIQYIGRSAIFAPQELTPRFNGVLVEMGSASSEGVLSADWNFLALHQLWQLSDTPLRKEAAPKQIERIVASLYARLENLAQQVELTSPDLLERVKDEPATDRKRTLRLDELPVSTTITRRWPPNKIDYAIVNPLTTNMPDLSHSSASTTAPPLSQPSGTPNEETRPIGSSTNPHSAAEDETEEMDALSESKSDE